MNANNVRTSDNPKRRINRKSYLTPNERRLHAASRMAVARAIKAGELIKLETCEDCGDGENVTYAWHSDYTKPLEVRWLCHPCLELKRRDAIRAYKARALPSERPLERLVKPGRHRCIPCRLGTHTDCSEPEGCRCDCRTEVWCILPFPVVEHIDREAAAAGMTRHIYLRSIVMANYGVS